MSGKLLQVQRFDFSSLAMTNSSDFTLLAISCLDKVVLKLGYQSG